MFRFYYYLFFLILYCTIDGHIIGHNSTKNKNYDYIVSAASDDSDWWVNGNYYQIYPRSFANSGGGDVGNLRGIKEKAQYLKDLGMDGIWLSPIMKSPMVDFGYDISDFRDIDPRFGTMQDFDELLQEFQKLGLHLILDFVPNRK